MIDKVTPHRMRVLYASSSPELDPDQAILLRMLSALAPSEVSPLVVCPERGAFTAELDRIGIPYELLDLECFGGQRPSSKIKGAARAATAPIARRAPR